MSGPKPTHAFVAAERQKRKRNLSEFAADLKATINKALPLKSADYRHVAVLAFSWSNDTMGVKTTEKELLDVLENQYGFDVDSFVIDASLSSLQVSQNIQERITKFQKDWDSKDSLMVYVYSGHGKLTANNKAYMIAGQVDKHVCLLEPKSIGSNQMAIEEGPELLAAANWNSVASDVLDTSFTRILAHQLKVLDGAACSVSHIFGKIHRDALTHNIGQVPIHVPHPTKDSIILKKLETPDEARESKRLKQQQIEALKGSESRVLIGVRIGDCPNDTDLGRWKLWLASKIPPSIDPSQISIKGLFGIGSSSTVLLVALPVAIWTALPANDTAFSFVSFVESGNHLLE